MKDSIREPLPPRPTPEPHEEAEPITNYCGETAPLPGGRTAVCTRYLDHEGAHQNSHGSVWAQRGETARREQDDTDNPHTEAFTAVWDNFLRTLGHDPDTVMKVVVERGHIIVNSTTVHHFEEEAR